MTADTLPGARRGPVALLLELTKFRISFASTITAATGYLAFQRSAGLGLAITLFGILLMAMGSCALNEVQEWELDAQMDRTRNRPIPSGAIGVGPAAALAFGLAAAGFLALLSLNLSAALLGALAMFWYNGVYTPLKRVSAFAVVPGALIGALPPAIGWCAAGGSLRDPGILALAFTYFVWQVPHFWLLVGLYAEGYEAAGFPTVLSRVGRHGLARLIFTWNCATAASCALLPLFRLVQAPAALALLAAGALWLVVTALPLLRREVDATVFRRAFMNINLFALVLTVAVIVEAFLGR